MPLTVIFGDIRGMDAEEIKPVLRRYGIKRLDTAASYAGGDSERRTGDARMADEFIIDTKILGGPLDSGALAPDKVEESSRLSLERLRTDQVNVLYCHIPDLKTPLEEQARGFNEIHKQGRFEELGLSNFNPDMVESWLRIAETKGYIKPTWFQGQYNFIYRAYEETLFPLLRKEGINFAAYSPLGGGFLKGNLRPQGATGTRFVEHSATKMYLGFYDHPACYDALRQLEEIAARTGLSTDELSLRWLMHHSRLQDNDVVILGASKIVQIEESLEKLFKAPLEKDVADDLNALWTLYLAEVSLAMVDPTQWKL